MNLTNNNYFSTDAQMEYFGVSQFKQFAKCESAALAEIKGEYQREKTTALLVGSYVDAYFEGTLDEFAGANPEIYKRDGSLKSDYIKAEEIISRVERDPLFMEYMSGAKQIIKTADMFGYPWKIKIDSYHHDKIVDLKVMRDMQDVYESGYGRRSFIEAWGYDIQGAVYQKVEQLATGREKPLPFYLAVATKEKVTDIAVIQIPQPVLDAALKIVESKIDRFALIKQGLVDPIRCETCDYCKETKVLTEPTIYEREDE